MPTIQTQSEVRFTLGAELIYAGLVLALLIAAWIFARR